MAWLNAARARLSTHPHELMPEARSLVVVGVSYRTVGAGGGPGGRIARYAWGSDYHDALKMRLHELAAFLGQGIRRREFSSTAARWSSATLPCGLVSGSAARTPIC